MNEHSTITEIARLFCERGDNMYAGEPVTQTEHALQAAFLAEGANAPAAQIAAALLHDVGHLLHGLGENCADEGIDDLHERLGGKWLRQHFPAVVCEPVEMHVAAKRFLCAVDSEYDGQLSVSSKRSLDLQGGPLSESEAIAFRTSPFHDAAVRLRRWDDAAKIPGLDTPPLSHFLKYVEQVLQSYE